MRRTKDPHDDFAGFAATVDGARLLDLWLDREATATSPLVDLGAQCAECSDASRGVPNGPDFPNRRPCPKSL